MITSQLESILRKDPITRNKFCGVYAEDRLPETLEQYPCGFIANTDPKGQPGKHWVAFYFRSPQQGEFFDSYGHPPQFYSDDFVVFLNEHCQEWIVNEKELQSLNSRFCGHYCIYYLMHRARGVSMETIVNRFSKNRLKNDQLVNHFVEALITQ